MNDQDHLKTIREYEIGLVLSLLPKGGSLLEIGAGSGWQSLKLSERGYEVSAIDLADSPYLNNTIFPVETYDGRRIPFNDSCFDIVFSSNVLEHIRDIDEYQTEIHRVLKPNGLALHVLPSGTWRFWTNITHYPYMGRRFKALARSIRPTATSQGETRVTATSQGETKVLARKDRYRKVHRVMWSLILSLMPVRHGEYGNAVSEIYLFSKHRWLRFFRKSGFEAVACYPNRLFYTGHDILGTKFSMPLRQTFSRILGSSCNIILLKKT